MLLNISISIDIKHNNYVSSINLKDWVTNVTYMLQDVRVLRLTLNNWQNHLREWGQIQSQTHVVFLLSSEYALPLLPAAIKISEANLLLTLPPSSLPSLFIRNLRQRNFRKYSLNLNYDPKTSFNLYVNSKITYTVTFRNLICFNCNISEHKSFECNKASLFRNEKKVIENLYESDSDKGGVRKSNLIILSVKDPKDKFFSIWDLYNKIYTSLKTKRTLLTSSPLTLLHIWVMSWGAII